MILFIEITVILGIIAFPIIKSLLGGNVEYAFYFGCVLGFHYDKLYFKAKVEDQDEPIDLKLHMYQFHLIFVSISMSFARETNDLIE